MGIIQCSVNSAHQWNDHMEFMKLHPTMDFSVPKDTFAPQTNHVDMKVQVPLGVKTALETKFAGTLDSTVAGVLQMLSEGEILIVPESDLQRLKERTNHRPKSASELFGIIFMLGEQVNDRQAEVDQLKQEVAAYEGRGGKTMVMLDLGDKYAEAAQRAKNQEPPEPLKFFLEKNLRNAIENNWF